MTWLRRLTCRIAGHRPIRVITGLAVDGWSTFGLSAVVTASQIDCQRCGEQLDQEVIRLGQ